MFVQSVTPCGMMAQGHLRDTMLVLFAKASIGSGLIMKIGIIQKIIAVFVTNHLKWVDRYFFHPIIFCEG